MFRLSATQPVKHGYRQFCFPSVFSLFRVFIVVSYVLLLLEDMYVLKYRRFPILSEEIFSFFSSVSHYCQRAQPSEDARLARRQHYRAVRIAEKISSACKVTFLL